MQPPQQQPWQQQEQYAASYQDQTLPNGQPQVQQEQEGLPVSSMDVSSDMKLHPTALYERATAALDQRHSAASDDPPQ